MRIILGALSLLFSLAIFAWIFVCHLVLFRDVDYSPVLWFQEAFVDNWENVAVVAVGMGIGAVFLCVGVSLVSRRAPTA